MGEVETSIIRPLRRVVPKPFEVEAALKGETIPPTTGPGMTTAQKVALAKKFMKLAGGIMKVEFDPGSIMNADADVPKGECTSQGHVWTAHLHEPLDDEDPQSTSMVFDDRQATPAAGFVKELRRVAAIFADIATKIEQANRD